MDEFDELMRIQRTMASRLHSESEMERKVELMSLIQSLNPDKQGRILTEQINVEARSEGFTDSEVQRLIDELESDGFVKRVEQGIMVLV